MNSEIENEINLKMCKTCGLTENKFQPNRKECIKCKSKKNNALYKNQNYFKEYYINNREKMLEHQNELYNTKYKKSLRISST